VGLGCILAPLAIALVLPKYLPGVPALKILAFGMCFASVVSITRNLFVAVNKQYRVLGAFLLATAVGVSLNYVFLELDLGITGVAFATSLAFLLLGILVLYMALSLQGRRSEILNVLIRVYLPSFVIAGIVLSLDSIIPFSMELQEAAVNTGIKLVTYLILILPLVYVFERQTQFVSWLFLKRRKIPA